MWNYVDKKVKKISIIKICLIAYVFLETVTISSGKGEQIKDNSHDVQERLNLEKRNLEKLQTQLQILELKDVDDKTSQDAGTQSGKLDNKKQANNKPIVISPNEYITLKKEVGEYGVPVYSIDATQVKVSDVLQALSASFGKSIIVDDDVDSSYLSQYINISIKKSPLQDILEAIIGMRGLEFVQRDDSIFVTALAKLNADTAYEYYRDKGVRCYQKAQLKYPNDSRVAKSYFELGNYYYDLGFSFLALQEYKIILGKYKNTPLAKESLFRTGRCYDNLKDPENARRVYFQFLYTYPKDPLIDDALLAIGDSLMQQGLYREAIDVYERLIQEFPDEDSSGKAQLNMAKAYIKMGNYRDALRALLLAREKSYADQMRSEIEYHIGRCLYFLNEYEDAGNVLGNLLVNEQEEEFFEDAVYLLGDCSFKQKNYLAAFQIFRKAIETYPKSKKIPYGIYSMGKSLNALGISEYAMKIFRDGIQAYSDDDYADKMAIEIGKCYFDKGNYWLAYNAFDSFTKQYADSAFLTEGLIGKADALFNDEKYEKAIHEYLGVLKANNEDKIRSYAFRRIGDCYKSLGKLKEAIKSYQMGLGKDTAAVQDALEPVGTSTSSIQHM